MINPLKPEHFVIKRINWLMLFKETIAVYSENGWSRWPLGLRHRSWPFGYWDRGCCGLRGTILAFAWRYWVKTRGISCVIVSSRDGIPGPPEYDARVPATRSRRSTLLIKCSSIALTTVITVARVKYPRFLVSSSSRHGIWFYVMSAVFKIRVHTKNRWFPRQETHIAGAGL
jgi:hypothetical protein